jgi:TIR domain
VTIPVTDVRGTAEHQIEMAAEALGQASQRCAVFREIHRGKKRTKTVEEIAKATALPRKRVLEEAVKLAHKQIITQTRRDGDTAYERDNFYYVNLAKILRRADQKSQKTEAPKRLMPSRRGSASRRVRAAATPRTRERLRYDAFLSHASEDKAAIAGPLYRALTKAGVSVWYDEAVLTIGDSLRRKIDQGLTRCRYGIVILSPKFFKKNWSQWELDGLVAKENASGEKAILPVWHKITKTQVANYSPTLADRLAGNSKEGIPALVRKIREAIEVPTKRRGRR